VKIESPRRETTIEQREISRKKSRKAAFWLRSCAGFASRTGYGTRTHFHYLGRLIAKWLSSSFEPAHPQNRSGELPEWLLVWFKFLVSIRSSFTEVVIAAAAIELSGTQATIFESCVLNRTGRDHCARAFPAAPCFHARRGSRV